VHHGCTIWPDGPDHGRAGPGFPPRTVVILFTWRGLLPECCPTTPSVRLRTRQAGRPTRPELLVWCGAPRRNRTGDPILTIDAPVVHKASQHLTCPHDRAGESRCPEVGSRAA
jgi:hypothetical protein